LTTIETQVGGKPLVIETGKLAKQADGAVTVRFGDTIVLATAVASDQPREGIDFFPLTVDFEEKLYSAGKIPGSRFIKREGRPSERAIVSARLVDRPIRPLFPKGLRNEVQLVVTTLSTDPENLPDVLGIVGASAALHISRIPWGGPVGAVRVCRVEGRLVANPTREQIDIADLNLVVAANRDGVIMAEAGANEVPESVMVEALEFGSAAIQPILQMQERLREQVGRDKTTFPVKEADPQVAEALEGYRDRIREALTSVDKVERLHAIDQETGAIAAELIERFPEKYATIPDQVSGFMKKVFRQMVLREHRRADGRRPDEIRQVTCEVGLLPRAHGSALFTRGQTQVLSSVTLGGVGEGQILDTLGPEEETKRYMHHYNFPPYSVGEARPLRGPSRRDIGHGMLAERALLPVIPDEETFPYTIRVVSDVLESNGSSSMASVCGSTLSLMDAGVPIREPVAGIAMGMVSEGEDYVILTDIRDIEDFNGDMDFKAAGTQHGITALQLDVKVGGLSHQVLVEGLERARQARREILNIMLETLPTVRPELAPHAPRVFTLEIHPDKIGDLIGPGGKIIKKIQSDFNVRIDVEQDGRVFIAALDGESGQGALRTVESLTKDVTVGETYVGKVVRIAPFGAFVELLPGKDGLLHISQISRERIERVEDVLSLGDEVMVKVLEVDPTGKVRLTRRGLTPAGDGGGEGEEAPARDERAGDGERQGGGDRRRRRRPRRRREE